MPCWLASPYILLFFPAFVVKSVRSERAMQVAVLILSILTLILGSFAYTDLVSSKDAIGLLCVPLFMPLGGPFILWGTYEILIRTHFKEDQLVTQYCRKCEYDLRGSVGSLRCPECGEPIPYSQRRFLRSEFDSN